MRRLLVLAPLASLLALASACGQEEAADRAEAPRRYVADLEPLNGTNVDGSARMALSDDHLTVDIDARGLERSIHAQHIHGVGGSAREAACPVPADDTDADGFVGLEEESAPTGATCWRSSPSPPSAQAAASTGT